MSSRRWTRTVIVAASLLAGCGYDSEEKIVRDGPPDVRPLAPGSTDGLDSTKTDRGAASIPSAVPDATK